MTQMPFGGPWTEEKLRILKLYLDSYTTALKNTLFNLIYVDAFAGSGSWRSDIGYSPDDYDDFQEVHKGSTSLALEVSDKPFDKLIFIEKDPARSLDLERLRLENKHRHIEVHNGDANQELPRFCQDMADYDRAVVFLDPFATQVQWSTVRAIAETQKIDCWILFPLMAIARLMPRDNEPSSLHAMRLDNVFGGREYWKDFYQPQAQLPLFGEANTERLAGSEQIAYRYQQHLKEIFTQVAPNSRTLRNSKNSPLVELFFAAGSPTGAPVAIRIADHILRNL